MKFKLHAGAELDLLTKDELKSALQDWAAELRRGVKFPRRVAQGTVTAAGTFSLAPKDFGPQGSFLWGLRRVSFRGLASTETVQIFINGAAFVGTFTAPGPPMNFSTGAVVLNSQELLTFSGTGLTVAEQVTIDIQSIEVPIRLAHILA